MVSSHNPERYHNINVPIPLELYEALRTASFETRISMSEIVRRAVASHLEAGAR
jgi:hypothetical protein